MPHFKKIGHIICKEEADGAFLFDPKTGNLKYINRMGKELFQMGEGIGDFERIRQALYSRYPEVAPERLQADAEEFFDQLVQNGFIVSGKY